jgi:hypothetical protein
MGHSVSPSRESWDRQLVFSRSWTLFIVQVDVLINVFRDEALCVVGVTKLTGKEFANDDGT